MMNIKLIDGKRLPCFSILCGAVLKDKFPLEKFRSIQKSDVVEVSLGVGGILVEHGWVEVIKRPYPVKKIKEDSVNRKDGK